MNFDEETLIEIEDYINALHEQVGLNISTLADIYKAIGKKRKELKNLPIHVSGSLPLIDVEEIKGLKNSIEKTGYTTFSHTNGGLRFISDLLDKLIMFHSNDR